MRKEEFYFDSRDNHSKIHAVRYMPDDGKVIGVLQIVHGMAEYVERYEETAQFFTEKGFVVTGEDHLGHGKTVGEDGLKGYFCKKDPATVVVRDVHRLKKLTQELYPSVPYYILGHSMGSFILRNYLCRYGRGIDGAIIMGTGMKPPVMIAAGRVLTAVCSVFPGSRAPGKLLNKIAFGSFNKKIVPQTTPCDWLSCNPENVNRYMEDSLCGFLFTVNGFRTLFDLMARVQNKEYLKNMPESIPLLMVSGAEDPVGGYGREVRRAYDSIKGAGVIDVELKLYEGDRHEILNEDDRFAVMKDICSWLRLHMTKSTFYVHREARDCQWSEQ